MSGVCVDTGKSCVQARSVIRVVSIWALMALFHAGHPTPSPLRAREVIERHPIESD